MTDPLCKIPVDCRTLVFQHIWGGLANLNLSRVSKLWHEYIRSRHDVMAKVIFNLRHDSRKLLTLSSRAYQHIKIRQEIMNQDTDFLLCLSPHIGSIESLSFEGIFDSNCIAEFFSCINHKSINLKHLLFIGEVTNIDHIMRGFSEITEVDKITLSGVSSNAFSLVFKHLRSKQIILSNMNLNRLIVSEFHQGY